MFAQNPPRHRHRRRRGVVLVLILAMLSIVALIGVTFATLSGQAQIGARYYAQSLYNPDAEQVLDYALTQLINDTNNPKSALRGHSLLRDMYGQDARTNGYLPHLPAPLGTPLTITNIVNFTNNIYTINTNIPTVNSPLIQQVPSLYNANFYGWVLRLQQWVIDPSGNPAWQVQTPLTIPQTFEVTFDNVTGPTHVLTLSVADTTTPGLLLPNTPAQVAPPAGYTVANIFELDGRYRRAFNGAGMSLGANAILPDRPNFLYNLPFVGGVYNPLAASGYNDPNNFAIAPAMDEDYDAADTENLFLGLQSADGQVVIPSFHRPNTIVYDPVNGVNDWTNPAFTSRAKFLRPRKIDHPASGDSFPNLIPDPTTGKITYDVDNDGDGVTDAVWLDLGYPVQRDASGKMYKPLFAFTIIGLNGRMPLNTSGNLQSRNQQTGQRLNDHISHLGYTPFEINPKFAFTNGASGGFDQGTIQLRQLLTGIATPPYVPGRYGEPEAFLAGQIPAAGRSYLASGGVLDYFDNNFNAADFYPPAAPESADLLDGAGRQQLPSERIRRFVTPIDLTGNGTVLEFDTTPFTSGNPGFGQGYDRWGRVSFFQYFRPPGVAAYDVPASANGDITKNTVNLYHGFESHRNPAGDLAVTPPPREFMALGPFNVGNNKTFPTFNNLINSTNPPVITQGMYPDGSLGLNEDSQIDLYKTNPYDAPFTNQDLEWLYRQDDVDGRSLQSRLSQLDQIYPNYRTFRDLDPVSGITPQTRRRLFSVESWENIHYAWFQNAFVPGNTPSLAHAGRKINLNYPLPVSNAFNEPVRLKWCREVYLLLKELYYPGFNPPNYAGATPEALAKLGQFVVNIVDFRDPDATMTQFINPDLDVKPAATVNGVQEPAGVQFAANPGQGTLQQWGMEYQPIALNEVLAYQFTYKNQSANPKQQPAQRLFVELANLLTEDGDGTAGNGGSASNLDLNGWGMIITMDNPAYTPPGGSNVVIERPNTVTGQLDPNTIKTYFVPLAGTTANPQPLANKIDALNYQSGNGALPNQGGGNNFYVMGNALPPTNNGTQAEIKPPATNATILNDLILQLPKYALGSGDAQYCWLHLLRPANPNSANMAAQPKVVVDSFRFVYTEAGGTVQNPNTTAETVTIGTPPLYSLGRSQPYRGAHAVPQSDTFTPNYPYGWSEQSSRATTDSGNYGQYDRNNPTGGTTTVQITQHIYHTLGQRNDARENWDYVPFLDRDFASVAELLLVPDCPPALFTKKFAENSDLPVAGQPFPPPYPYTTPPTTANNSTLPQVADLPDPHPYPYIPQNFHYYGSQSGEKTAWYMMLEFFEVPSPVFGAIGPVTQGDNGDWLRQEVKPGLLNINLIIDEEVFFGLIDDPRLNTNQATLTAPLPQIVTSIDATGTPNHSYPISDTSAYPLGRGYYNGTATFMKAAFSDFLKLRHGGSGFIGSFQSPFYPATSIGNAYPEKPYRSLSTLLLNGANPPFLDIHDTIMRPARTQASATAGNEGIKPLTTSIPPRMLFQIPDANIASPSSEIGTIPNTTFVPNTNLSNPNADLFVTTTPLGANGFLGAGGNNDRRQHPYFQSEMLQKVMNLTTVRTHQFAVWVTVGFFEVVQEGNPQLVNVDPTLVVDQLGREIGKDSGRNVRIRAFFIVDRSKATGFNPYDPDDFRKLVVYERRIE